MENRALEEYINILERCNEKYTAWFRRRATWFFPKRFTKREKVTINECLERQGNRRTPKECYANSQLLAFLSEGKIQYAEGYALSDIGLPVEHGFNVIGNKVLDITWKGGLHYVGIVFPAHVIKSYFEKEVLKDCHIDRLLPKQYREYIVRRRA